MELLSLIMLVLLIAGLKYDKANTANKASKYDKSKISMGKMAVDNEKDPHKVNQKILMGYYDKDDHWKI